jgi:uncharacterized protein YegP (UPF0339 family)
VAPALTWIARVDIVRRVTESKMVVEVPDDAALVRATLPAAPRYQVLQDTAGQWYWLLVDADRKVLAVSGEYFLSRASAQRAVEAVHAIAAGAPVVAIDSPQ